jgi:cytochrome P450
VSAQQEVVSARNVRERVRRYSSHRTTPDEAFALFEEARALGPVHYSEELGGFYLVLDYAECKTVHSDHDTFSNEPAILRPYEGRPRIPFLEYDNPVHMEWRQLLAPAITPETPKRLEPALRQDVIRLVERLAEQGSCDLVSDFAEHIPVQMVCHLLDLDPEVGPEFRRLGMDYVESLSDPERLPATFQAVAEYGLNLVMERQAQPRDDFLTWLGSAEFCGRPVGPEEISGVVMVPLTAGHDTAVSGLTSVLHEVLSRPQIKQRLLESPELIPAAVDEGLRLHPPFIGFFRRAVRDTTLGGVEIPADAALQILWLAANRDPKVFEDPLAFRLDRQPGRNRHLTFGWGIHACPGQATARMELRVALEELLRLLPDIELADPQAVRYKFIGGEACHITSLPAVYELAEARL